MLLFGTILAVYLLPHFSLVLAVEYLYTIYIQGGFIPYLCPSVHQNMLCTAEQRLFIT